MKRFESLLIFLHVPLDYLMLLAAAWTAYAIRFTEPFTAVRPVVFKITPHAFSITTLGVAALWIGIFAVSGLYSTDPNRKFARDAGRIVLACSAGFAAITIYIFFSLQKFDSRFLVLGSSVLAIVFVTTGRLIMVGIKRLCYRAGYNLRRTVLIGSSSITAAIKETFQQETYHGYRVVDSITHAQSIDHQRILDARPDEIIVTDSKTHPEETLELVKFCTEHHIVFKYTADLFATIASNISISSISGIPIIEIRRTRLAGWGSMIKRLTDIIISCLLLLLCSPLLAIVALIIYVETGRPILYKNERVGQRGKKFFVYKFRSMYQRDCTGEQFGASGTAALAREQQLIRERSIKNGPIYKIKDDPRVTPFGRFLRRSSIDELPQLLNVAQGTMSLVGPRPHQPREVAQYEKHHIFVLSVKPGITGLAQISGRSTLSYEEEMSLDTLYIEHWSLLTDLIIMLKTPYAVFKKEGVL